MSAACNQTGELQSQLLAVSGKALTGFRISEQSKFRVDDRNAVWLILTFEGGMEVVLPISSQFHTMARLSDPGAPARR